MVVVLAHPHHNLRLLIPGQPQNQNQQPKINKMKTTDNFKAIKQEILYRAHAHHACREQYGRAYASETLQELCNVIKDNFSWCCLNKVLTAELIKQYQADFSANGIYVSTDVTEGYLLATGNAKVIAYDNATVEANDNATVRAYDNATVEARGNAKVIARGNAKVIANDNATVIANDNATVEAYDNATVEAYDNAKVIAYDNATVEAYDNATVEAYGNVYCVSYLAIKCRLSGNALHRVLSTNTVYFANDDIKFQKQ